LRATLAGTVLATALSFAVVLSVSQRTVAMAGHGSVWMAACWLGAALALLAILRRTLPIAPVMVSAPLWWIAGVLAAAVLGRHALDSLSIAAAELPITSQVVGSVDLGDLLLWALMLVAIQASAGSRSARRPGPRLGIALVVMLLPAVVLLAMNFETSRMRVSLLEPMWTGAPWRSAAALSWVLAVVTCEKERAAGRLGLATWLPPLVGCALLVALPWWLLASHGGAGLSRVDGAFFLHSGGRVFGYYGGRVGAGIETLVTLAGIVGLLVFSARWPLVARLFGAWERLVAISLSALAAALVPLPDLFMLAALIGWIAVIMGLPPRREAGWEESVENE
jgi:hypothetical protein